MNGLEARSTISKLALWGVGVGLLARPLWIENGLEARSTKVNLLVGSRGWASSPPAVY
ncbi:hypothetical protein QUB16_10005 [Microcoleus sp. D3_18a_C4]